MMRVRKGKAVAVLVIAMSLPAFPAKKAQAGKVVDAGSFGIFVNGRRVGTETFKIEQQGEVNVATSEVTVDDGQTKAKQSSELQLALDGALRRYEWRELSPGKAQTVIEPANEFLIQHINPGPGRKTEDQPYVLTPTTAILDDYFFSHRELLTWRYLAGACKPGAPQCQLVRTQFGVLVPRQRVSLTVTLDYGGREKMTLKGASRELDRFNLQCEGVDWAMWFDENHKLIRILIAGENVEILRD